MLDFWQYGWEIRENKNKTPHHRDTEKSKRKPLKVYFDFAVSWAAVCQPYLRDYGPLPFKGKELSPINGICNAPPRH